MRYTSWSPWVSMGGVERRAADGGKKISGDARFEDVYGHARSVFEFLIHPSFYSIPFFVCCCRFAIEERCRTHRHMRATDEPSRTQRAPPGGRELISVIFPFHRSSSRVVSGRVASIMPDAALGFTKAVCGRSRESPETDEQGASTVRRKGPRPDFVVLKAAWERCAYN